MNTFPREPHAGDRISAQLIRDIIRCLRRITPLAGPGTRLSVSPNGTTISASASSFAAGGGSSDKGCFRIVTLEDDGEKRKAFGNCYFMIGGQFREVEETAYLDEFVMQGELEEGEEYTAADKPYVALVVSMLLDDFGAASFVGYEEEDDMAEDAGNPTLYVRPLYKLTHDGGVAIDFRNMPQLAAAEFEQVQES